ncbi:MAG: hypothetical protein ABI868_18850 [Acidobacteriota bacterium]
MKRYVTIAALTLAALAPLAAQAPQGWKVRADRSTSASDPDASGAIKFMAMGNGFHAITPQAAVFWNPANTATGNYTLKGTFTQLKASSHTNYYGLVFGGEHLDTAEQTYLYFTVAQDGTWLIKRREGDVNTKNVSQAANAAVKKLDATGKSVNALEVRVMADKVDFVVNGTVVHSAPKTGLTAKTDGLYGMRSNHALEVMAEGISVTKQ